MAQSPDPIEFASLLCSKLCHDLLSPVGALNNGFELLADETDPKMREQCLTLIRDSADTAAGKLKFFRLAFGAASGYDAAIPVHEIKDAIEGICPPGGKTAIDWMIAGDTLPKPAAKLLLNLAMMTNEALVRGGTLTIGAEHTGGAIEIVVRGEGSRILLDPNIRAALGGAGGEVTHRTAAAYLIRTVVEQNSGQIMTSAADDPFLLFGASLPVPG